MAAGHPDAGDYVIAQVWDEVGIVKERQDHQLVMLAVVVQKATSTTGMTASKESVEAFNRFIKDLNGE